MASLAAPPEFEHTYARSLPSLAASWAADISSQPQLVIANPKLAIDLGIDADWLASNEALHLFSGNGTTKDAERYALAYAGHQFGSYSPRLGDGRALLIGEFSDPKGQKWDLHLKGSGRTPFARGGDGKATLGPMLREFLMGEAMAALGIPTTRALAVISTGELAMRERPLPGAILVRVAASHLRVGTFQYAAALDSVDDLRALADYAIARHYPELDSGSERYLSLLTAVIERQASLVAEWMLVGFIHGVMNTDNVTISGETIDYGPCAFMDTVDPQTVFSSIDEGGRYAYGRQPAITQWNLARFAETLLPLIAADPEDAIAPATEALEAFPETFSRHWHSGMNQRLGFSTQVAGDDDLANDLMALLQERRLDLISTMRSLADQLRGRDIGLGEWATRWETRLQLEGVPNLELIARLEAANPIYVPRNHLVEEALSAAVDGDLTPFEALLERVTHPYEEVSGAERYARAGEPVPGYRTYCGT
ncbi:MAG: protein adenylyltransferase SelO [Ilumatobacteraceae bacterium]